MADIAWYLRPWAVAGYFVAAGIGWLWNGLDWMGWLLVGVGVAISLFAWLARTPATGRD